MKCGCHRRCWASIRNWTRRCMFLKVAARTSGVTIWISRRMFSRTHQVYEVCSCRHALLDDPTGKSQVGVKSGDLEGHRPRETRAASRLRNRLFPSLLSSYLFVLPTSFMWILKTHNRSSLQIWLANVLHFCSFCKPTFSGATREWDALYYGAGTTYTNIRYTYT
jgi:hypothetical protein